MELKKLYLIMLSYDLPYLDPLGFRKFRDLITSCEYISLSIHILNRTMDIL